MSSRQIIQICASGCAQYCREAAAVTDTIVEQRKYAKAADQCGCGAGCGVRCDERPRIIRELVDAAESRDV